MNFSPRECDLLHRATEKAQQLGHEIGTPRRNFELIIGPCTKCLCLFVIHEDATIDGVAVTFTCDSDVSKNGEFIHEPMSAEYRERLNKPWRPPGETVKKK